VISLPKAQNKQRIPQRVGATLEFTAPALGHDSYSVSEDYGWDYVKGLAFSRGYDRAVNVRVDVFAKLYNPIQIGLLVDNVYVAKEVYDSLEEIFGNSTNMIPALSIYRNKPLQENKKTANELMAFWSIYSFSESIGNRVAKRMGSSWRTALEKAVMPSRALFYLASGASGGDTSVDKATIVRKYLKERSIPETKLLFDLINDLETNGDSISYATGEQIANRLGARFSRIESILNEKEVFESSEKGVFRFSMGFRELYKGQIDPMHS